MPSPMMIPLLMLSLSGLAAPLYSRLSTLGFFRYPWLQTSVHGSEHHFISNSINCEDLHLESKSGLLFAACHAVDDARNGWFPPLTHWENVEDAWRGDGGIYVIDPRTFTSTRLEVDNLPDIPFATHGIDITPDPSNPSAIYIHAVNHLPNPFHYSSISGVSANSSLPHAASQIEIFHHVLHTKTASHVRSVHHSLVETPNDIFSLGPGEMLVTNDHWYREGGMRILEEMGGEETTAWTNIIHLKADIHTSHHSSPKALNRWEKIDQAIKIGSKGVDAHVALRGLHNNNGLGHHVDPNKIIINDASGGKTYIGTLIRDSSKHIRIKVEDKVTIHHTLDNPSYFSDPYATASSDKSGILQAGLVNGMYFTASPGARKGASIVTFMQERGEKEWSQRVIFKDDGDLIKSASAAVLVPLDPKGEEKREAWMFVTGFYSAGILAVKVVL